MRGSPTPHAGRPKISLCGFGDLRSHDCAGSETTAVNISAAPAGLGNPLPNPSGGGERTSDSPPPEGLGVGDSAKLLEASNLIKPNDVYSSGSETLAQHSPKTWDAPVSS